MDVRVLFESPLHKQLDAVLLSVLEEPVGVHWEDVGGAVVLKENHNIYFIFPFSH